MANATVEPAAPAPPAPPRSAVPGLLAVGAAVAAVVAGGLTVLTGARPVSSLGLPDPGTLTTVGLPAVRAVAEVCMVLTIGGVLLAAFLAPPQRNGYLDGTGYRALRAGVVECGRLDRGRRADGAPERGRRAGPTRLAGALTRAAGTDRAQARRPDILGDDGGDRRDRAHRLSHGADLGLVGRVARAGAWPDRCPSPSPGTPRPEARTTSPPTASCCTSSPQRCGWAASPPCWARRPRGPPTARPPWPPSCRGSRRWRSSAG